MSEIHDMTLFDLSMQRARDIAMQIARPGLEFCVVGLQHIQASGFPGRWRNVRTGSIEFARQQYDVGRVELCQGRARDDHGRLWVLLYAIPRREQRRIHLDHFGTRKAA